MIFNNSVTVYHNTSHGYIRQYYLRASIFGKEELETNMGSRVEKKGVCVRLFTRDNPEIETGDMMVIGYEKSPEPPEDALVILKVSKNCQGSFRTRHFKLYAV